MVEEVLTAEVILIDSSSLSKKVIIYWFPIIFNVMAEKRGSISFCPPVNGI